MKATESLAEQVKAVLNELPSTGEPMFSRAVMDAMALADKYADIKPVEFILPLDALAGMGQFSCSRETDS